MEKPIFTNEERELMAQAREQLNVRYFCRKEDFEEEKIREVLKCQKKY